MTENLPECYRDEEPIMSEEDTARPGVLILAAGVIVLALALGVFGTFGLFGSDRDKPAPARATDALPGETFDTAELWKDHYGRVHVEGYGTIMTEDEALFLECVKFWRLRDCAQFVP